MVEASFPGWVFPLVKFLCTVWKILSDSMDALPAKVLLKSTSVTILIIAESCPSARHPSSHGCGVAVSITFQGNQCATALVRECRTSRLLQAWKATNGPMDGNALDDFGIPNLMMLDSLSKEWHVLVPNLERPSCVVLKLDGVFPVGIQDARMAIPKTCRVLKALPAAFSMEDHVPLPPCQRILVIDPDWNPRLACLDS